jgi:uncharacterized membrane protein
MIYAKALVPLAVTPLLFVLEKIGIAPDMTIEEALTFVVTMGLTALMVYAVPNRK